MRLVIDASVAVKWIFPEPDREKDVDRALDLLRHIGSGRVEVVQPVHWLLEVSAVVTRIRPQAAADAASLLDAMELPECHDLEVLRRGISLAERLSHHLFDTLYHAVALECDADLVTADIKYAAKARSLGRVVLLEELSIGPSSPSSSG